MGDSATGEPWDQLDTLDLQSAVVDGFARLIAIDHSQPTDQPLDEALSALSIDQVNSNEPLLNRLHSELLPLLKEQLNTISLSLIPSTISSKEPDKKLLRLILRTQSEIERTIYQIRSMITAVCPVCSGPISEVSVTHRTDDQHLKAQKSFRLFRVQELFNQSVMFIMHPVFTQAQGLFHQLVTIPPNELKPESDRPSYRGELTFFISCASTAIDWTIRTINGPELEIAQEYWKRELPWFNFYIRELLELTTPLPPTAIELTVERQQDLGVLVHGTVIQVAKLIIPIIKLIRLLFNKLSKRPMNPKEGFPLFTEMCSSQLESLARQLKRISQDIKLLLDLLNKADRSFDDMISYEFTGVIQNLKSRLDSLLLLILLYFVPSIQNTDAFSTQDDYKAWLVTWNTQLILSIHNFDDAVRLFHNNPF
ncbi:hypothetical protein PGTUg99_012528 [Puccinia graminis f. sp. tritici]|uniref:Uncharacterized protein n=1 Tax=Puccinia graminis f. sp. tritici TaxID=56615 RepID=A0A5B0N1T9_PUCGR|nr:hypothetical protein PGTUg99_012528 [Puccinia graminis f. sp. tritici]